jgi:hypothetical protein
MLSFTHASKDKHVTKPNKIINIESDPRLSRGLEPYRLVPSPGFPNPQHCWLFSPRHGVVAKAL